MIRLAIVGGALQGMETVYLAHKAGYTAVVIDRREDAPASSLADEFHVLDPLRDPDGAGKVFGGCDAVIPACEDTELLESLVHQCSGIGVPLLFDMDSYRVSSSKLLSNEMMGKAGVPLPGRWPECGFPVVVKPSAQSGSIGVSVAFDDEDLAHGLARVRALGDEPVIQEFVSGRSISIEMIGNGREYRSFVTTEVVLDSNYDCRMVICEPHILSDNDEKAFENMAEKVAETMGLRALCDLEAIVTSDGPRVLEIDARIPSQTPAAVYMATGVNLLEELVNISLGIPGSGRERQRGSSVYYHLVYRDGILRMCGEKEFGHVRNPRFVHGLFGSDDAVTDYEPGKREWRATLISRGRDRDDVMDRVVTSIKEIEKVCDVTEYVEASPEVV